MHLAPIVRCIVRHGVLPANNILEQDLQKRVPFLIIFEKGRGILSFSQILYDIKRGMVFSAVERLIC